MNRSMRIPLPEASPRCDCPRSARCESTFLATPARRANRPWLALSLFAGLLLLVQARSEEQFFLRDGDRVVAIAAFRAGLAEQDGMGDDGGPGTDGAGPAGPQGGG